MKTSDKKDLPEEISALRSLIAPMLNGHSAVAILAALVAMYVGSMKAVGFTKQEATDYLAEVWDLDFEGGLSGHSAKRAPIQ